MAIPNYAALRAEFVQLLQRGDDAWTESEAQRIADEMSDEEILEWFDEGDEGETDE